MTRRKPRSSWGTRMADGALSPKVTVPSLLLAAVGAILAILDLLSVVDVEDELWLTLLGAGGVTFGTGYAADPGPVVRDERGLTLLEALVALLVVGLFVLAVIVLT